MYHFSSFLRLKPQIPATAGTTGKGPRTIKCGRACIPGLHLRSLPDLKFLDERSVSFKVGSLKVFEELAPLSDDFQQTASGVCVLLMNLEVLGQIGDSLGEQGYLGFDRSGILVAIAILNHDLGLVLFGQCHLLYLLPLL